MMIRYGNILFCGVVLWLTCAGVVAAQTPDNEKSQPKEQATAQPEGEKGSEGSDTTKTEDGAEAEGGEVVEAPEPTRIAPRFARFLSRREVREGAHRDKTKPWPTIFSSASRKQLKRLDRALKKRVKRVQRNRAVYRKQVRDSKGGQSEIRLCSLNLNSFGLLPEVKNLVRGSGMTRKRYRKRKTSLAEAIVIGRCDVVALQGVIGRDPAVCAEAMAELVAEIDEVEKLNWEIILGESNHRFARNAFLVNRDSVTITDAISHESTKLPRYGAFNKKVFFRGPIELRLRVKGQDGAETRNLTVLNALLQNKLSVRSPETTKDRMQMAASLRQLLTLAERTAKRDEKPIFVAFADTTSPFTDPADLVLQGRYRLSDYRRGGPCKIGVGNVTSCETQPRRAAYLYPLMVNQRTSGFRYVKRLKEPEPSEDEEEVEEEEEPQPKEVWYKIHPTSRRTRITNIEARRARTTEAYVLQSDLEYVLDQGDPTRYLNVGTVEVKNGLKNSPLIWVELNW